jgi:NAD(P)-dependent dehydrogenase (short-subunit alcohol dehydrogenase family)
MVLERLRLDGKVAVVTGAGRGLGQQMALALAEAGADVVCAARTKEQIDATADAIRSLGRKALAVATDVRFSAQCDALIDACVEQFGTIDIMLSNAGIGDARGTNVEVWDLNDDDWRDTIDVNLSSAFYCARAASRRMVDLNKPSGVIINVASGTALRAYTQNFGYGAAKAGVIALTKSLAVMLQRYGIRVNCIIPGFVLQQPPATPELAAMISARARYVPARRMGEAWELGPLAVYLASEASSYVTGQGFVIDGGGLAGGVAPVGFAPEVG